jgi:hypothetical protein
MAGNSPRSFHMRNASSTTSVRQRPSKKKQVHPEQAIADALASKRKVPMASLTRSMSISVTATTDKELTVGQAEFLNRVIEEASDKFKQYLETECTFASVSILS